MKKLLLATTMLVTAGTYAAADVSVSGSARMGVASYDGDSVMSSRVRIKFSGSGTSDGGLAFGASMRADQSGQGNDANGDSTVFISGAFGKITMGDTGNAVDSLVGNVSAVGYGAKYPGKTSLDGANELGLLDNANKTGVSYNLTVGGATVEVGSGQIDGAAEYYSGAVAYAVSGISFAVGYESNSTDSQTKASVSAKVGPATVKAAVADRDSHDDIGYAVSADFAMAGATVTAYYADDNAEEANIAVGAAYDLGGGAVIKAGVGNIYDAVQGDTVVVADAGVTLSF